MIGKKVTKGGIISKVTVDMESLIEEYISPLNNAFKTVKKMVLRREKHIRRLHKNIKSPDNILFTVYAASKIKSTIVHDIPLKAYMILSYMYDIDYVNPTTIKNYFISVGVDLKCTMNDMKSLSDKGLVVREGIGRFFYITDLGRQKLESVVSVYKSSMKYFVDNKKKFNTKKVYENGKRRITPKFSEEQKKERSIMYRKMMLPFWESGFKRVPKDKKLRVNTLADWLEKNETEDKEYYINYMKKWSQ